MHIQTLQLLNDCEIKKFLLIILSIQLAFWGVIGCDALGIYVPILTQIISITYLLFVPGILILRVFKIHRLTFSETVLYTIGLSIAFLMFLGITINTLLPVIGIKQPISRLPLIISISFFVIVLSFLSYKSENDLYNKNLLNININIRLPIILFLLFLPLLTILGTYMVNTHNNNSILMAVIIIISILPAYVIFHKTTDSIHVLTVFIISLSLLFHRALISPQLWGSDIFEELYYAKFIIENSYWHYEIYNNLNAMLSITMIPPIISNLSHISVEWIFKIIYPLIYSLVPVGIYLLFNKYVNSKIAFLSVCYFMFINEFFGVMPVMARQEIGELFYILSILIITTKSNSMTNLCKSILSIVFGLSLVVSHYALSYIYLLSIIILWLLESQFNKKFMLFYKEKTKQKFSLNYVLIMLVFTFTWYIYVSGGSSFDTIASILKTMYLNFIDGLFKIGATEGLAFISAGTSSILYKILKLLFIISQFLIAVGIMALILSPFSDKIYKYFNNNQYKLQNNYIIFAIFNFTLLVAALLVPYFSGNLGTMRLFHITLIILAPFFVIGSITINRLIGQKINKMIDYISLKTLSVFLCVFLLFNSGFMHELFNDKNPCSISLSTNEVYRNNHTFNKKEFCGAEYTKNIDQSIISTDIYGRQILRCYVWPKDRIKVFREETRILPSNSYIYFRQINIDKNLIMIIPKKKLETVERPYKILNINEVSCLNFLISRSLLYSNGGSQVWK